MPANQEGRTPTLNATTSHRHFICECRAYWCERVRKETLGGDIVVSFYNNMGAAQRVPRSSEEQPLLGPRGSRRRSTVPDGGEQLVTPAGLCRLFWGTVEEGELILVPEVGEEATEIEAAIEANEELTSAPSPRKRTRSPPPRLRPIELRPPELRQLPDAELVALQERWRAAVTRAEARTADIIKKFGELYAV